MFIITIYYINEYLHLLSTALQNKGQKKITDAARNISIHIKVFILLLGLEMIYLRPTYLNNSISLKTPGALCI